MAAKLPVGGLLAALGSGAGSDRLGRLDHFKGIEAYWEVPAAAENGGGRMLAAGTGRCFTTALRQKKACFLLLRKI
jgi:hypothetical protein